MRRLHHDEDCAIIQMIPKIIEWGMPKKFQPAYICCTCGLLEKINEQKEEEETRRDSRN